MKSGFIRCGRSLALFATLAMSLVACGGTSPGSSSSGSHFLACEVTDTGGIDDRSFNASAWKGLQEAKSSTGTQIQYLQSSSGSDYAPNIQQFEQRKCGIIVTVGYLMGQATQTAAKSDPSQKFAIVDYSYPKPLKNVLALLYQTDQDAFLGGYLAAATSKTGKVGTFGGQDIPTVTIYMSGFVAGVRYYDQKNHAHVQALGWDPEKNTGSFTNDFTDQAKGNALTQALMGQGADIIFPVAGNVGLGAAAAVQQHNQSNPSSPVHMEWVDVDGCVSAPQYCSLFLTSVTKGIVPSVEHAAVSADKSSFKGGNYTGTLANDGVSLAPYHDFQSKIPQSVQSALATIKKGIIDGSISVKPGSYPSV
ncbi:MAG TPA: BMP family ABC transporter substrate-binding protein [Candidatus Dormibacteraeota bacterium]|jgi:basic membrane protein A|nr:BMP family ABC transporter substrate-binding protein [Candidatus Dormibacteraeota bacterium]